jgi:putative toxin-antitoxin system antitoxin component (TIGR02293 family)
LERNKRWYIFILEIVKYITMALKNKSKKSSVPPKESTHLVQEEAILYNKAANAIKPILNFGSPIVGGSAKPVIQMTAYEKMSLARLGVSKKGLETLKHTIDVDYDALAKALSVTRATLINKKGEEKFNPQLSERIVGLAEIYSYGYEVFDDPNRFNRWMQRPNQALNGQAPYDLLDSQFGREEVKNVIGRIDYGVYS